MPAALDHLAFIAAHAPLLPPPMVPELRVHTAAAVTPVWEATEAHLGITETEPPFWAFPWPGSQALARWILDHPAEVAGLRVLDVGTGGGLAAIAAASVGARVAANDVDPLALAATQLNARANGVEVELLHGDLTARGEAIAADLVLVGDLFYEQTLSERLFTWLRLLARDRRVIVAEPGRAFAPRAHVRAIARYTVPTTMDLEGRRELVAELLEVVGG